MENTNIEELVGGRERPRESMCGTNGGTERMKRAREFPNKSATMIWDVPPNTVKDLVPSTALLEGGENFRMWGLVRALGSFRLSSKKIVPYWSLLLSDRSFFVTRSTGPKGLDPQPCFRSYQTELKYLFLLLG